MGPWANRLLTLMACAACAWPQTVSSQGAMQGTISDPTGAAVPVAAITARNADSGAVRATESDANGHFSIVGLPIGTYKVKLTKAGFNDIETGEFLVSVGQTVVQNFTLQLAGTVGRIEVNERLDAVETAATTTSEAFGYDRIEEVPTRNRNYLNFVKLAPGVAASAGAPNQKTVAGIRGPLMDSGFSFGGLRGRNNAINIDGADNRDETTGGSRVVIGLEMVQEFRVAGIAVGAELGGAAGGMIHVVTKSGSNVWHGDVDFFFQNELFNARNPEAETAARPRARHYQPGTSFNGPLRKDRTFIAAAFEYEHESGQEWSEVSDEAQAAVNRALATAAYAGTGVRAVGGGLYRTGARGLEFSTKFDHQLSATSTIALRYGFSRGRDDGDVQEATNFQDRSAAGRGLTRDHSFVANWTAVLSPTTVNVLRGQVAERSQQFRPNASGPLFEIPGVVTFGQAYRLNSDRTERHYQATENINFVAGSHRLSAGVDVQAVTLAARIANRFGGIFLFPTLADFERAAPDVFIQAFGDAKTSFNTLPVGLWLEDRWQARRGLLLEMGARFDRQRMPHGLPSSTNAVSPRLGLAWTPSARRPLVVRAGWGLFYDRYPLAYLNDALQKNGSTAFEQYAVGEAAVRALATASGSTLSAPLSGAVTSTYRAAADFPATYARKLSAGIEQGLDKNTTLTVEASEVRGYHLPRTRNVAGTLPPLYELEQTARSEFRGGSVSVRRRMSNELAFLIAYSAGVTKDDGSDFDEQPMNPLNARADWARSRQHQAHRFTASALYELPGENMPAALHNISLGPVFVVGSGRPINALLTSDVYRTGAFPISARPAGMGRNPFYTLATVQLDLRIVKSIPILHERAKLLVGAESTNLLNHTNPLRLNEYYSAGGARLASYGRIVEAQSAREIQFLVNFEY